MGVVEDKVIKNHYAAEYIYNKYKNVLRQINVLKIAVDVGLVVGITAPIMPIGSTIFLSPYASSFSITPQV